MSVSWVPFSPLTVDSLVGAAIHAAAFGGRDGYVLAYELADAVALRVNGRNADNAYSGFIDVGQRVRVGEEASA